MKHHGFTLPELLVAISMVAILAALALPSLNDYIRQARLYDAQSALLTNAKYLEQFYAQKYRYKQNSTTWATLPIQKTAHFCIKMQGDPRGITKGSDRYTMKAVAINKEREPRVLVINEDFRLMRCETSTSTCQENNHFFKGNSSRVDKNCTSL